MIDKKTIDHISYLSKLKLDPSKEEAMIQSLESILSYVDSINQVSTENVEIMYNPLGRKNVFRKDEIRPSLSRSQALANAPAQEAGCFQVPKVLKEKGAEDGAEE